MSTSHGAGTARASGSVPVATRLTGQRHDRDGRHRQQRGHHDYIGRQPIVSPQLLRHDVGRGRGGAQRGRSAPYASPAAVSPTATAIARPANRARRRLDVRRQRRIAPCFRKVANDSDPPIPSKASGVVMSPSVLKFALAAAAASTRAHHHQSRRARQDQRVRDQPRPQLANRCGNCSRSPSRPTNEYRTPREVVDRHQQGDRQHTGTLAGWPFGAPCEATAIKRSAGRRRPGCCDRRPATRSMLRKPRGEPQQPGDQVAQSNRQQHDANKHRKHAHCRVTLQLRNRPSYKTGMRGMPIQYTSRFVCWKTCGGAKPRLRSAAPSPITAKIGSRILATSTMCQLRMPCPATAQRAAISKTSAATADVARIEAISTPVMLL